VYQWGRSALQGHSSATADVSRCYASGGSAEITRKTPESGSNCGNWASVHSGWARLVEAVNKVNIVNFQRICIPLSSFLIFKLTNLLKKFFNLPLTTKRGGSNFLQFAPRQISHSRQEMTCVVLSGLEDLNWGQALWRDVPMGVPEGQESPGRRR